MRKSNRHQKRELLCKQALNKRYGKLATYKADDAKAWRQEDKADEPEGSRLPYWLRD